jgi:hypothetical protein
MGEKDSQSKFAISEMGRVNSFKPQLDSFLAGVFSIS